MHTHTVSRQDELREHALRTLQESGVLMRRGHFDYGNGYHGRVYLNPHELFRQPSTIWRLAQDLYGDRLSLSWRRLTAQEYEAMFARAGLDGAFWALSSSG